MPRPNGWGQLKPAQPAMQLILRKAKFAACYSRFSHLEKKKNNCAISQKLFSAFLNVSILPGKLSKEENEEK